MSSEQLIAFAASAGITASELKQLITFILMSLTYIFVIILMKGNHLSWSKEYIDTGEYAARTIGLIFIIIIVVYLGN